MTLDDFKISTELMFQAFAPIKPTDRLRALYEFFKLEEREDIYHTAKVISFEHERFPSPMIFGSVLKRIKERRLKNKPQSVIECSWCKSSGALTVRDGEGLLWAYRCNCANGSKFQAYPSWFGKDHPGKVLLDEYYKQKKEEEIPPF